IRPNAAGQSRFGSDARASRGPRQTGDTGPASSRYPPVSREVIYPPPVFGAALGAAKISFTGAFASNTRLKKPTIISSQLWSPHLTSCLGSVLSGLFGELSKWAVHSIRAPFGRTIGSARLYQSCQCQL